MRFVIGRRWVDGHLPAAVAERDLRLAFAAGGLRDRELLVEPGEACGAGENELSTRHWPNVEVGDLVETACEQSPCRIAGQRLLLDAGGEHTNQGQTARPREHSGRTKRQQRQLQK